MADPNKLKRGQFCVIGERHSSTMMHGSTADGWSYSVGKIAKASKAGDTIKEAFAYRYGTAHRLREADQPKWWQSYALRGNAQGRAAELLGQEFTTLEHVRDAFRT